MSQTITVKKTMKETVKKVVYDPFFAMIYFISVCYILPQYVGGIATMVACASMLSVYVAVSPEQYRNRNGSMRTAYSLVAALWVAAAVVTVMILTGQSR